MNVDWMSAFTVLITGMVVVFLALIALVLLIMAMGKIMSMMTGRAIPVNRLNPKHRFPRQRLLPPNPK